MKTDTYINTDIIMDNVNDINRRIEKINDLFSKTNVDFDEIKKYDNWTGRTSETVLGKYDQLKTNYDSVIYSLKTLANFMSGVADAYIRFDEYVYKMVSESDLEV